METAFPVETNRLKERMKKEMEAYMLDNCQAWILQADGSYVRCQPAEGEEEIKAQSILLETLATPAS